MLSEAIFAIFVTLLVVTILQNLLKSVTTADRAGHRTDDIAFAYVQFDRFFHDNETETAYIFEGGSNSRQVGIVKVEKSGQKKTYLLNFYKNMLRMTTPEGGHMPLLLNVKRAIFTHTSKQILIKVTETDNRYSELVFELDKPPIKKKTRNAQIKIPKSKS
ncbi:ComGF family competence protein [Lactobacillus sp. ESL0681]|uniref:ComGF family competence protein n=1 Tax=Lactobacillus sp. ESL0681 TaxID=2983211 RepID=UPI0023F8075B|nr:ComGF family competence protein [Lactobacillus sp. ESL0681]WEV40522.1 ComGF family competence protein [Lactobacillus sp. ESL0681]